MKPHSLLILSVGLLWSLPAFAACDEPYGMCVSQCATQAAATLSAAWHFLAAATAQLTERVATS